MIVIIYKYVDTIKHSVNNNFYNKVLQTPENIQTSIVLTNCDIILYNVRLYFNLVFSHLLKRVYILIVCSHYDLKYFVIVVTIGIIILVNAIHMVA